MSSPLILPPECSWPECLYCKQPVTGAQQDIGRTYYFEGAGLVHAKCLTAAVTMIESEMVRS